MSDPQPPRRRDESLGAENANTLLVGGEVHVRPDDIAAATAAGLRHLGMVTLAAVIAALFTYVIPGLERLQPIRGDEGIPVARMFLEDGPSMGAMTIATGGADGSGGPAIADELGDAVAANLAEPAAQPPRPTPASDDGGEEDAEPAVHIGDDELEGLVREIEGPTEALVPFYRALRMTALGEDDRVTRIAHYGDSSIAGDGITMTLRRRFQGRFGDAGHGFHLPARGTMPYRHRDMEHGSSGRWQLRELVRGALGSGDYGFGGVQARGVPGARASYGTHERGPVGRAMSRFELWYEQHPTGGDLEVRVDDGEWERFSTRAEEIGGGRHVVEMPDGAHEVEVRVRGNTRLFGAVLEREGPGVVYDSLGLVGARARRLLGYDETHLREQLAMRETDLIVIAFGGNEADDTNRDGEMFERDYRRVIQLMRAARPEAGCLLMAPLDQATRNERGHIRTMPQVPVIVDAQRRAAAAEGCAFFDTFAAMGGEGAMRRWYRTRPRLAFGDFRHATPDGYRVVGNMLYKALLKGFSDWLEAGGE